MAIPRLFVMAMATTLALSGGGLTPAAASASSDTCTWRFSAVRLYQELAGEDSVRAVVLRGLLAASGVGDPDFVPAECKAAPPGRSTPGSGSGSGGSPGDASPGSGGAGSGGTGSGSSGSSHCETTAADTLGWGEPNREADFNDANALDDFSLYDGPGHAGNGTRSPSAASVSDGMLTISGDSSGTTEGMAWNPGQMYGRWEGCVKSPTGNPDYNSLLLLWPDAENFPVGGEVDFMEISDQSRQSVELFLHYGADNSQVQGNVDVDATQWHSWAVEWTPDHIAAFLDGKQWWKTTDTSILPPGPMHLCIQLDWFPGGGGGGGGGAEQNVDWVKQYPAPGGGSDAGSSSSGNGSSGSRSSGQSSSSNSGSSSSGSSNSDGSDSDGSDSSGSGSSDDSSGS